jgi:hypothetical protein
MSDSPHFDYRLNFPTTGLALALEGFDALRAELGIETNTLLGHMLGDPRGADGNIVVPPVRSIDDPPDTSVVWVGRPGMAAYTYTDPNDEVVEVPAKGDPSRYYMHIRTMDDHGAVAFDPAQYGLLPTDPVESAAVLGVWAGDDVSRQPRPHLP